MAAFRGALCGIVLLLSVSSALVQGQPAPEETTNSPSATAPPAPPPLAKCAVPAHRQACTLDLSSGQTGSFECQYMLPSPTMQKVYTTEGDSAAITELVPEVHVERKNAATSITIPADFKKSVCFAMTCSQINSVATQAAVGTPSREDAMKLVRYTVLVRVNGGVPECEDEPALKRNTSPNPSDSA
ncbi:hypothetical protein BESB_020090 [Besnoitia besnoiti]|uniref:SAG-related sequence n=1 Tax=Besnoitia besnoiti TaxID=94643 RepID=A0A2A9M0E6_BESBE|nr:hypothetical protein BESB_020090 [Besnoitia besnoiti]PFH32068.1 hypothetical protein BESB_020090 [Besnoitia besnoiti]